MRCKECKYAYAIQTRGMNKRYECFCGHPDKEYIADYFAKNRIQKMVGFISFSEPYSTEPKIKTAPKFCPLKRRSDNA